MSVDLVERAARLHHTRLFGRLPPGALRSLAAVAEPVELQPGDVACAAGEPATHVYVVTSGLLRAKRVVDGAPVVLGELFKGDFFGENALLDGRTRSASVEAASRVTLLRLASADVREALERFPGAQRTLEAEISRRVAHPVRPFRPPVESLLEVLRGAFPGAPEELLRSLAPEVGWVWVPEETVVVRQGDAGDGLYVVRSGRLRVYVERPDGSKVRVGDARDGDFVGEIALISGGPRSASAATVVPCELVWLSRAGFETLSREFPSATQAIVRELVDRLTRRLQGEDVLARLRVQSELTQEDVEEVVATQDLVLRNLRITETYHRLAVELVPMLGAQDVNWPAFGCHASRTAGYAIRRQELPLYPVYEALVHQRWLGGSVQRVAGWVERSGLVSAVVDAANAASHAVSGGNLRIFGDMAPVFARFLQGFREDTTYDAPKLEAFLATLEPGRAEDGGQETLGRGLRAYYEAAFEPDPKRRSELILLGNVYVGLHEQTRVQPDIEEALGSVLRGRLGDDVGRVLFREERGWLPERARRRLRARTDALEHRVLDAIAVAVRRTLTRHQMALRLPGGDSLRLGVDLPVDRRHEFFPPELRHLEHPELRAVVARIDRGDDTARGTAAIDWASLDDRMNHILNLFRSRQKDLSFFTPPYQYDQVAALRGGHLPSGRL
jgi:CRP-like cAMP-binding protein